MAGDEQPGAEAAEHGHAAEVRDRGRVHVAVAHPGDRTGPDRQLAGEDAEQVADDAGHQEDEEVLTHGPGRLRRWRRARVGRRARPLQLGARGPRGTAPALPVPSAPARRIRGRFAGAVDDRRGGRRPGSARRRGSTSTAQPSIRSASSASVAAGVPGGVGRGDRQRSGAAEQLEGGLVVGHPDGDGAAGLPQVPAQRRLLAAHDRERSGPEVLDQSGRPARAARWRAPRAWCWPRSAPAAACPGRAPWRRAAAARPSASKASTPMP